MSDSHRNSDILIIGGGIVGLATAYRIQSRHADARVRIVEAESTVAAHQSSHNSGVIHSGIYYQPGSTKALTCRAGKAAMEAFCDEQAIRWDRCGKVVVATSGRELETLDRIQTRAQQNGVQYERIDSDTLRELEPNAAGIAALFVPETGIVNYATVSKQLARLITDRGGSIELNSHVVSIETAANSVQVRTQCGDQFEAGQLINCAGLYSDRVARMAGITPEAQIVPFRGEYYELVAEREDLVRNLIYPVPDPSFPFLGVHFTRMIDGGVECGPNAVLAFSRTGYQWRRMNFKDFSQSICFPGFRKLAVRHWKTGLGEIRRSLSKPAFVTALQKLMPCLRASDLKRGRTGVRAQAVSPQGVLVDDFIIQRSDSSIHVLNAPSPAATASLAIADKIIDQL